MLGIIKDGVFDVLDKVEERISYDFNYVCLVVCMNFEDEFNIFKCDIDGDGIVDLWDDCVDFMFGVMVDDFGCEVKEFDMVLELSVVDFMLDNVKIINLFNVNIEFVFNFIEVLFEYENLFWDVIEVLNNDLNLGVIIYGYVFLDGDVVYN